MAKRAVSIPRVPIREFTKLFAGQSLEYCDDLKVRLVAEALLPHFLQHDWEVADVDDDRAEHERNFITAEIASCHSEALGDLLHADRLIDVVIDREHQESARFRLLLIAGQCGQARQTARRRRTCEAEGERDEEHNERNRNLQR